MILTNPGLLLFIGYEKWRTAVGTMNISLITNQDFQMAIFESYGSKTNDGIKIM